MLSLPARTNVYLYMRPVDLRKSFDGLSAIVAVVFQRNVFDGHLFLFINKRRDRVKALWWEGDGWVIWYKRLERGGFELPRDALEQDHVTLDATALAMLLGGVPLATPRRVRYRRGA
jgi:transposase